MAATKTVKRSYSTLRRVERKAESGSRLKKKAAPSTRKTLERASRSEREWTRHERLIGAKRESDHRNREEREHDRGRVAKRKYGR